jgi:hypothetical protein
MCQFTALVSSDEAAAVAKIPEKGQADVDGWFFRFCQEHPYPARGTVDNEEVCTVPIIRRYNTVRVVVGFAVVVCRSPHKPEVHVELRTLRRDALCCRSGGLLPDIRPFLEVDTLERVVFQDWRETENMLGENVELVLAGRAKS